MNIPPGCLFSLDLAYNGIGDEGSRALAQSPNLASLTLLDLGRNRIGDEGARALAQSEHLASLTRLNLWNNDISKIEGLKKFCNMSWQNTRRSYTNHCRGAQKQALWQGKAIGSI